MKNQNVIDVDDREVIELEDQEVIDLTGEEESNTVQKSDNQTYVYVFFNHNVKIKQLGDWRTRLTRGPPLVLK